MSQARALIGALTQPIVSCATALLLLPTMIFAAPEDDRALYESACAGCHGSDGAGRSEDELIYAVPSADFTDCAFASREPDPDWFAIIHEGGPIRAFDRMMPAFGDVFTDDEIWSILRHVRTFCPDDNWPAGEFNLPRPLFTEKAFVEDEYVYHLDSVGGDSDRMTFQLTNEKRFGARSMWEMELPVTQQNSIIDGDTVTSLGDVSVSVKHAFNHDLAAGRILAAGLEVTAPFGDDAEGIGRGSVIYEPFITWGKLLPRDAFIQGHSFVQIPYKDHLENRLGINFTIGKTYFGGGPFGRAWSPMIELLYQKDLASGFDANVAIAPQFQVALNARQHILFNFGAQIPVNNTDVRDTQYRIYLIWDWYDGAFFEGW